MQFDPRQSQKPPPPIEPTGFFTGVQIRPIILGIVTDYVVTYAAMYAYFFVYLAGKLAKEGEVTSDMITEYMTSTEGLIIGFAIGMACTALGGFVAGRKAGRLEVKHGGFVGLGSLAVSFIEQSLQTESVVLPEWFRMMSIVVIIPAGALGGYLAGLFKQATEGLPPAGRPGKAGP
jgi:hypothetical protein